MGLHCLAFILGILLAPDLYLSEEHRGSQCRIRDSKGQDGKKVMTWYDGDASRGNCQPLGMADRVPLRGTVSSFRFPRNSGKVI